MHFSPLCFASMAHWLLANSNLQRIPDMGKSQWFNQRKILEHPKIGIPANSTRHSIARTRAEKPTNRFINIRKQGGRGSIFFFFFFLFHGPSAIDLFTLRLTLVKST